MNWKLQIAKRYKRNATNGDLRCSQRISSNFHDEKKSEIRSDFSSAVYPMTFVKSVINDFESKEHNLINDTQLFISRF